MSRRDDEVLQGRVLERLNDDPTITVESIDVLVSDGHVSLSGSVESRDDRKWVEALVRQMPGVVDVENYLTIEPEERRPEPPENQPTM